MQQSLYHQAWSILLEPPRQASHTGIRLTIPTGEVITAFPELLSFACDLPEAHYWVNAFDSINCRFPCDQCLSPSTALSDLSQSSLDVLRLSGHFSRDKAAQYHDAFHPNVRQRTEAYQKAAQQYVAAGRTVSERRAHASEKPTHDMVCCHWGFKGGSTKACCSTGWDLLHIME